MKDKINKFNQEIKDKLNNPDWSKNIAKRVINEYRKNGTSNNGKSFFTISNYKFVSSLAAILIIVILSIVLINYNSTTDNNSEYVSLLYTTDMSSITEILK